MIEMKDIAINREAKIFEYTSFAKKKFQRAFMPAGILTHILQISPRN